MSWYFGVAASTITIRLVAFRGAVDVTTLLAGRTEEHPMIIGLTALLTSVELKSPQVCPQGGSDGNNL